MQALLSCDRRTTCRTSLLESPPPHRFGCRHSRYATDADGRDSLSAGRMVILHDQWAESAGTGTFHIVSQLRTQMDAEMIGDPMLSEVRKAGSRLLGDAGANSHDMTRTVTRENQYGSLDFADGFVPVLQIMYPNIVRNGLWVASGPRCGRRTVVSW